MRGRRFDAGAAREAGLRCLLVGLALLPAASPADAGDAGLLLEIDGYRLRVRDRESGEPGPTVAVATGSPAQPTPVGGFPLYRVILRPRWNPGVDALANGAEPEPASTSSPMGVAKIPFADAGSIALHGGGDPHVIGKPVSSGCVRLSDADLLRVIAWLDLRDALGPPIERDGEIHRAIRRPTRLVIRPPP